jgi:hypothetical protein
MCLLSGITTIYEYRVRMTILQILYTHAISLHYVTEKKKLIWPESMSKPHQPCNHHLSAKLVSTSVEKGCHMVSLTHPYGRILGFLDRSRYFFFQGAPQLYSWGWMEPVSDPLRLRKSGCARGWNSDHYTTLTKCTRPTKDCTACLPLCSSGLRLEGGDPNTFSFQHRSNMLTNFPYQQKNLFHQHNTVRKNYLTPLVICGIQHTTFKYTYHKANRPKTI